MTVISPSSSSEPPDPMMGGKAGPEQDIRSAASLREHYYFVPKRAVHWGLLSALVLAFLLFVTSGVWLPKVAEVLIVADPLGTAAVIIVLGGGGDHRPKHAAQLYHQGFAPAIITTGGDLNLPGLRLTGAGLARDLLVREGVPPEVILTADWTYSTVEDAAAAGEIMVQHGWTTAIVVTEAYHSRRARLILGRVLGAAGRSFVVRPTMGTLKPETWWRRQETLLAVATEYLKFAALVLGIGQETVAAGPPP